MQLCRFCGIFLFIQAMYLFLINIKSMGDNSCKFPVFVFYCLCYLIVIKGIYLSKALTCMIFSCINKMLFHQGDGYFWSHCCMNN